MMALFWPRAVGTGPGLATRAVAVMGEVGTVSGKAGITWLLWIDLGPDG
jgi:hypothetical protein